jgi:ACT domain-containing protein
MRAIVTVIGKDRVGINAMVSGGCAKHGVNIVDITQTVMKEYFAIIMLVELDKLDVPFREFTEEMKQSGKEFGVDISVMHEDIFNTMHRI